MKNSLFILTLASLFSVVTCTAAEKQLEEHHVIILHKGDPFPAPGVLYSYDSPETEKDFDRRRKEQEAKTIRKEDVTDKLIRQYEIIIDGKTHTVQEWHVTPLKGAVG